MVERNGLPCPVCRTDLVMSERQDIEIDYCPQCRGVWLDRGELDKIIERSAREESERERDGISRNDNTRQQSENRGGHGSRHGTPSGSHSRRNGFLRDIFG